MQPLQGFFSLATAAQDHQIISIGYLLTTFNLLTYFSP
jgi:hypothetical protein